MILIIAICTRLGQYISKFSVDNPDADTEELSKLNLFLVASTVYSFVVANPFIAYVYIHYFLADDGRKEETSQGGRAKFGALEEFEGSINNSIICAKNLKTLGIFDLICVYGYSFLPYVVGVIIATIPIRYVEYIGIGVGFMWSSSFLFCYFRHVCYFADNEKLFPTKIVDNLDALKFELGETSGLMDINDLEDDIEAAKERKLPYFTIGILLFVHLIFAFTLKLKFFSNA